MPKIINKPTKESLRKILMKNTNDQAAKILSVGSRTIQRWRNFYCLDNESVCIGDHVMTNFQKDLITGCMLGDGSIRRQNKNHNTRFEFGQKSERKQYVRFVYDSLKPYSIWIRDQKPVKGPVRNKNGSISQKCGKLCQSTKMYTVSCELFKKMREQWYKEEKIIPDDIKLNWTSFAFWFADDGHNNHQKKTITLSTNCFCQEDVEKLSFFLYRDLGIESNVRNWSLGPIITIGANFYEDVMSNVRNHLLDIECLFNKLNSPIEHDYKTYNPNIPDEILNEIWSARINGISVSEIEKQYGLSKSTIYRVLKKNSLVTKQPFPTYRKLSENKVKQIINAWNKNKIQSEIALDLNISQTMVSAIINRKNYGDVTKNMYIRKVDSLFDTACVNVIYNIK